MSNGMTGGGHSGGGHSGHHGGHFGAWIIFFWFVKEFQWALPIIILLLLMGV